MSTFIVAFIILMLVGVGMAIGVIFGRQPIKGSCGGLGAVGVERACGCKDVCENKELPAEDESTDTAKVERYRP